MDEQDNRYLELSIENREVKYIILKSNYKTYYLYDRIS